METLTKEFGISKSEIARRAFEQYIQQYRKQKLQQIAESMVEEYKNNPELTVFTNLHSEAFK